PVRRLRRRRGRGRPGPRVLSQGTLPRVRLLQTGAARGGLRPEGRGHWEDPEARVPELREAVAAGCNSVCGETRILLGSFPRDADLPPSRPARGHAAYGPGRHRAARLDNRHSPGGGSGSGQVPEHSDASLIRGGRSAMERHGGHLDPVTFEVLKNAFVNLVDQMSEQILRTCY